MHPYKRALAGIALLVILVVGPSTFLYLRNPHRAEAAWFDSNWGFRQRMPISNSSGSTQTDFQVQLTIDTATLVTAGKLQSGCQDIRFTNLTGKNLPYWVEPTTCNTTTTKVWVKVDSIPTSGTDIFFYYGNASAASTADTSKTFIRDMTGVAAAWPLDDTTTTQSFSRVQNATVSAGRNIVVNGTFDADASWSKGAGWTISGGALHGSATGANTTQTIPLVIGKAYSVTYTISNLSAGGVRVGLSGGGTFRSADGTYTETVISSVSTVLTISSSTFTGDIDNISVTQLNIPADSAVPAQLLTDGNMETAGTSSWTADNGATLTKQTTSPHGGSQVLRVAATAISSQARQTILTAGQVYRVSGYVRSDGVGIPRLLIGGSTINFSGNTSTAWQPFDVVAVADGTTLNLRTGTTAQYTEWDDVTVSLDTAIRPGELLQDQDMEASGTTLWTATNNATISKQTGTAHGGSQVLRVAYNGTGSPAAFQAVLVNGKRYRVTGFARSDGTALPRILELSTIFGGTTSTSWQPIDATFVAGTSGLAFGINGGTSGQYVEYDDLSIQEIPPLVGLPTNGVTLGSSSGSGGHLTNAYTFDGTNDFVNIYSSDLNSVFTPDEGSVVVWAKVSGSGVWTDGQSRELVNFQNGSGSQIQIVKGAPNNTILYQYSGSSTVSSNQVAGFSSTNWMQFVMTWSKSKNQLTSYFNGSPIGSTQTIPGTWSGNLSSTQGALIGALSTSANLPWSGMMNDVRLYSRALSPDEVAAQYSASTDIQAYTTGNYSGHELLRKYNTSVTVGAAATEEVGASPAGYWKFDEGTGTTARDSSTRNNTGTLTNMASPPTALSGWTTEEECISGKCLKFDGSNDSVVVADSVSQEPNTLTVGAWVKINSLSSNNGVFSKGSISTGDGLNGYHLRVLNTGVVRGVIYTGTNTESIIDTTRTLSTNTWYYLSLVYDGSTARIYINGQQAASSAVTGNMDYTGGGQPFKIGQSWSNTNTEYFNGFIDEPKFYDYSRTAAQIKSDYIQGAARAGSSSVQGFQNQGFLSDGLQGYWSMDEGTGTSLTDKSGNGHTGSMCESLTTNCGIQGPSWSSGKFGSAPSFDGSNDGINTGSVQTTNTSHTYSAWIYLTAAPVTTTRVIVGGNSGVGTFGVNPNLSLTYTSCGGNCGFGLNTTAGDLSLNTWTHVVVTSNYNSASNRLTNIIYKNGQIIGQQTITPTGTVFVRWGGIGMYTADSNNTATPPWLTGKIDEVRVYYRTLSPDEVRQLYNFAPGPTAYWKFDEKTGTTANDGSGNGYTGTLTSGPTWVTGKYGSALNFDKATTPYVDISSASLGSVITTTGTYTMEAWFKVTTQPTITGQIIEFSNSGTDRNGLILGTNGRIAAGYYNGSYTIVSSTPSTIQTNTWYHAAFVNNGGTVTLYLNGGAQKFTTDGGGLGGSLSAVKRIGHGGPSSVVTIDDVKIYNYARTPAQIIEDMRGSGGNGVISSVGGTSTTQPATPLGYWKFDEQQGQTENNSGSLGSLTSGTSGANSGSSTDDPTWKIPENCKVNGCLSFDGGDEVNITSSTSLRPDNITLSAWIKTSSSNQMILAHDGLSPYGADLYITSSGFARIEVDTVNTTVVSLIGTTLVNNNSWHHIVGTYDGAKIRLFVDGKEDATPLAVSAGGAIEYSSAWVVGSRSNALFFNGLIDELKIYNSALSPDQVKVDYNYSSSLVEGGLGVSEAATDLTDGAGVAPVGEWKFEEKTGTTTADTSGNNYLGTLTNGPTWSQGKFGSAVKFDGVNDQVHAANSSSLPGLPISFSVWVNPSVNGTSRGIFAKGANSTATPQVVINGSNQVNIQSIATPSNINVTSTGTIPINQWTHIEGVMDATSTKIYINGKLDTNSTYATKTITPNATNLIIGVVDANNSTSPFTGSIDELKIYNYTRTPAQVAYDYNRGGPIGWWKFDECQGTSISDWSGNNNVGTLTIGASGTQTAVGTCNTTSSAWGNGNSGKYNNSMSFDGTDDIVTITPNTSSQISSGLATISLWAYPTSSSTNSYIFDSGTTSNRFTVIWYPTNSTYNGFAAHFGTGSTWATSSRVAAINTWHHIVATSDGTNTKLYVDGNLVSTVAMDTAATPTVWKIGSTSTSDWFAGKVDDVRVFNYAVGPAMVKKLYNYGSSVFYGPSSGAP